MTGRRHSRGVRSMLVREKRIATMDHSFDSILVEDHLEWHSEGRILDMFSDRTVNIIIFMDHNEILDIGTRVHSKIMRERRESVTTKLKKNIQQICIQI
jgi:hypothetical protein